MKAMKLTPSYQENGSTLIWAMTTILILSLAGAAVLTNSTTRYNATSKQVKGWKEALGAAEAGADLGFAQVRLYGLYDPLNPPRKGFASADGWASPAPSPLPTTGSWNRGYTTTPPTFGEDNSLSAKVTVDQFAFLPGSTTVGYYRIRSVGTARVGGLKRTGMDDALQSNAAPSPGGTPIVHFAADGRVRGNGDSLLRKIDFKLDHFIATYGYGDALPSAAATSANGKSAVPVANPDFAQVTRRVELIALPIMPIEAGIKTAGKFRGTTVDSYDSKNTATNGSSYYGTGTGASFPEDARDGDVACGGSDFYASGNPLAIYGDVTTNGGNATNSNVTGVVDNNVPFALPTATPGKAPIPNLPGSTAGANPAMESGTPTTIDPPNRPLANGKKQTEFWYTYSSLTNVLGLTINPLKATVNGTDTPLDTTVNIYVTGDVGTKFAVTNLKVNKGVTANIYFTGNMEGQALSFVNNNVDGPGGNGVYVRNYVYNPVTAKYEDTTPVATFTASTLVSKAGHLWFYGLSPTDGSPRTIDIAPPGDVWAAFYAPSHNFGDNGNPDIYGVMVCKSFYQNGGTAFHFDKQLLTFLPPLDYRVASYIEDVR